MMMPPPPRPVTATARGGGGGGGGGGAAPPMMVLVDNISAVMDKADAEVLKTTVAKEANSGAGGNSGLDRTLLSILNACGEVKTWRRVMHPITNAPVRFGFASFERGADACEIAVTCVDGLVIAGSRLKLRPNAFTKAVVDTNRKERAAASASYKAGVRAFKRKQKEDELAQKQRQKEELDEQKLTPKKEEGEDGEEVKDDNVKVATVVDASAAAPVDAAHVEKSTDCGGGGGTKENRGEGDPPATADAMLPAADAPVTEGERVKDVGDHVEKDVEMRVEKEEEQDVEDPNDPMVAVSMAVRRVRDVIKALVDDFHSAHPEAAAATQALLRKEEEMKDHKEGEGAGAAVTGVTREGGEGGDTENANDVGSFLAGMRRKTMLDLSTSAEDLRTQTEHGVIKHGRDDLRSKSGNEDEEPASPAPRPDVVVSRDADRERERGGWERDGGSRHRDRDRDRRRGHAEHRSGRDMSSRERDYERRERDATKQRAYKLAREEDDVRERRRIIRRDEQVTSDDEIDMLYRLRRSVDKEDSRERRERVARRKKREREKEEDSKLKRHNTAPNMSAPPAGESGVDPRAAAAPPHDGDNPGTRNVNIEKRIDPVKIGFGLGVGTSIAPTAPAAIVGDGDDDDDDDGPRRPIIPIDYSVEELAAAHMPATAMGDMDADADVEPGITTEAILKSLEASIPSTKAEVFATAVEWDHLLGDANVVSTMARVTDWLKKEIEEQFGEVDNTLIEFIIETISGRCAPQVLLEEFEPLLESSAEEFVVGLWRLVILEARKAKHGLV